MWSDRRSFLLALPALVAGCGFAPVYGPGGTATELYGKVDVATPTDYATFKFVENIEATLGRSQTPEFKLSYTLRTFTTGQAVTSTGDTTRYNLIGEVKYVLTRLSTKSVVFDGQAENFVGYSATGSTVDTLSAERDAERRLMVILAQQVADRLFLIPDLAE